MQAGLVHTQTHNITPHTVKQCLHNFILAIELAYDSTTNTTCHTECMGLAAHSTPAQLALPLSTAQLHSKQGVECHVQSAECRVQSAEYGEQSTASRVWYSFLL